MEIRLCQEKDIESTGEFYDNLVLWLESHVNYPRWVYKVYPSKEFVEEKTKDGTFYICIDQGQIVGAFVLNDDPEGDYYKGDWTADLVDGEYLGDVDLGRGIEYIPEFSLYELNLC